MSTRIQHNLYNITEYTLQLCDWQMYRVGILQTPPAPVRLMKSKVELALASGLEPGESQEF